MWRASVPFAVGAAATAARLSGGALPAAAVAASRWFSTEPQLPSGPNMLAESPSLKERLKQTVKLYGLTASVFHSSVYVLSLGTTFAAVRSGLDTAELLHSWGLGDRVGNIPAEAGDLAAAWCICAVTGPARGVLTVTASPVIARILKRRGAGNNSKATIDRTDEGSRV